MSTLLLHLATFESGDGPLIHLMCKARLHLVPRVIPNSHPMQLFVEMVSLPCLRVDITTPTHVLDFGLVVAG